MSFAVSNCDSDNDSAKWFIRIQRHVQYFLSVSTISSMTRNLWAGKHKHRSTDQQLCKYHCAIYPSHDTPHTHTHYCTISSHPLLIVSSLPSALTLSVYLPVSLPPPCFSHILFTLNLPSIQTPSLVPISLLLPVFNVLSHTDIHNITNNAQRIYQLK